MTKGKKVEVKERERERESRYGDLDGEEEVREKGGGEAGRGRKGKEGGREEREEGAESLSLIHI
eukprot:628848-Rhodomonas_salina.3